MYKLVIAYSHGVSVVDGTEIHCRAQYEITKKDNFHSVVAMFLYNEKGVLLDIFRSHHFDNYMPSSITN